jgi:uncharacterized protein
MKKLLAMKQLLVFLALCLVVYLYLVLRLSPGLGWPVWVLVGAMVLSVVSYPLSWKRVPGAALRSYRFFVHMSMGLLSFLGSFVVMRDLFFLPLDWFWPHLGEWIFGPQGSLIVFALTLVALAAGTWSAVSGPIVREVDIPLRALPRELEGYRIAQISDLHVGPTIGREYVERVVEKVQRLHPHLTALTGDIADGHIDEYREAIAPLAKLVRKDPGSEQVSAFFVPGNHEYYWNGPRWIQEFEALGFKALLNSNVTLEHRGHEILVAGVVDPAARLEHSDLRPDARAARGRDENEKENTAVKILLAHHPGIARSAAEVGFDLQLSGHTHAGQFFPWTLVIGRIHEFARGLKECGRMWVYVNPGTGTWGPPIRLGTRAEITLLTLRGADR